MNWNANKSVRLSQVCVVIFAALLLALDIGCYWAVTWFVRLRRMQPPMVLWMMLTIYLCSIFAWLLLAQLWRLLRNIQAGRVFEEENVVCLGSTFWYLPFAAVAVAACFMALIVRIVKNVFQQALAMKSELDLTV